MSGDKVFLLHIADCIRAIEEFTNQGEVHFLQSRLVRDAVYRNFEIIGEASKQLSPEFREMHTGVPWKNIIGFRNILIHGYVTVNPDTVWQTIVRDLPGLKGLLARLL